MDRAIGEVITDPTRQEGDSSGQMDAATLYVKGRARLEE
jgi:hypothetical protein